MKPSGVDPEYQRYRRSYPKFPGVGSCVDLLRKRNVHGAYLDGVMGDLQEHASANFDELLVAFHAETDSRVRSLSLSIIAETGEQTAFSTFSETLLGADEDLRVWAARGLYVLGTSDAKKTLREARSKRFATPEETERFQQMLKDVERWKHP